MPSRSTVRSASRAQSSACSSYSFFSAEIIVVYVLLDKRAPTHCRRTARSAQGRTASLLKSRPPAA
jgi:hypothetical protein